MLFSFWQEPVATAICSDFATEGSYKTALYKLD